MEPRILNFVEAMELAKVIDKYVTNEVINSDDPLQELLSKISPIEFTLCLKLFSGLTVEGISNRSGLSNAELFINGLKANKIGQLIKVYRGN